MSLSRPNLALLTARLSSDNSRVSRTFDRLVEQMDGLVAAVQGEDWAEIGRQAADLASRDSDPVIAEAARRVVDAVDRPHNPRTIRRALIRLIGACGRSA